MVGRHVGVRKPRKKDSRKTGTRKKRKTTKRKSNRKYKRRSTSRSPTMFTGSYTYRRGRGAAVAPNKPIPKPGRRPDKRGGSNKPSKRKSTPGNRKVPRPAPRKSRSLLRSILKYFNLSGNPHSLPFAKDQLGEGFDEAYKAKEGYYIGTDENGNKVMYVAGTRNMQDWGANALDTMATFLDSEERSLLANALPLDKNESLPIDFLDLDTSRTHNALVLDGVARRNNVDTVIGHSRGAALVGDMKYNAKKYGMDGAALISRDKDMENYIEGGIKGMFDELIAWDGRNNIRADQGPAFHKVWE